MKRKRINHQVDIFCEMFSGWKLSQDIDTLIQLQSGQFTFDFLLKNVKLNNEPFDRNLTILFEISDWFEHDLTHNNIEKTSINSATLVVDFILKVIDGKPKSRTRKIIDINLKMKSSIVTDEKEYIATKEKTMKYHYIERKSINAQ